MGVLVPAFGGKLRCGLVAGASASEKVRAWVWFDALLMQYCFGVTIVLRASVAVIALHLLACWCGWWFLFEVSPMFA